MFLPLDFPLVLSLLFCLYLYRLVCVSFFCPLSLSLFSLSLSLSSLSPLSLLSLSLSFCCHLYRFSAVAIVCVSKAAGEGEESRELE